MSFWPTGIYGNYWTDGAVGANLLVVFNILGALGLGLLVGYERSYHGHALAETDIRSWWRFDVIPSERL